MNDVITAVLTSSQSSSSSHRTPAASLPLPTSLVEREKRAGWGREDARENIHSAATFDVMLLAKKQAGSSSNSSNGGGGGSSGERTISNPFLHRSHRPHLPSNPLRVRDVPLLTPCTTSLRQFLPRSATRSRSARSKRKQLSVPSRRKCNFRQRYTERTVEWHLHAHSCTYIHYAVFRLSGSLYGEKNNVL